MSSRYGISLVPQPSFTAGLHRARQVICSQYASWAAEMHMVHLPLFGYFQCPENAVQPLETALESVARDFKRDNPNVFLSREGVTSEAADGGSIFLEFADAGNVLAEPSGRGHSGQGRNNNPTAAPAIGHLREAAAGVIAGLHLNPEASGQSLSFALMQHATLPGPVFESAVTFAAGVIEGLELPRYTSLAQLVFIRFESDAAGEDWSKGGWAADLRWRILGSYPL